MKKLFLLFALTFSIVLISACSSAANPAASIIEEGKFDTSVQKVEDHHEGETNVAPHSDNSVPTEEHNDEGIEPHGHDEVMPHDDSDQPPHRH